VGVVVDAKADAAPFYARHGLQRLEVLAGASESRPTPTTMFLPIFEILAAAGDES